MSNEWIVDKLNRIGEDVADIKQVLYGNGEPEKGLYFRVKMVEQTLGGARKVIWGVFGAAMTPGAIMALVQYFLKG